jgi:cephalosporin hydroxylase
MKLTIDDVEKTLQDHDTGRVLNLYSRESFELLSRQWLRTGWSLRYPYSFTWLGRPIIQLPEDLVRIQELVYTIKPDVIVETGVAHGGGLVFFASVCRAMGRGRVIGVELQLKPNNRHDIEAHELSSLITLIEGNSVSPDVVASVRKQIRPSDSVLVILDSDHSKTHVTAELEAYGPLVTSGSYVVATDGAMEFLADVPRGSPEWVWNNPQAAAKAFAANNSHFVLEEPAWKFNEGDIRERVTFWPSCYLRRL